VTTDGKVLVVDQTLGVLRIDLPSGDRTIVSSAERGSGVLFGSPLDIAIETDGTILVADEEVRFLIAVDPVTGDRSQRNVDGGTPIRAPKAVAIAPDGGIFVLDGFFSFIHFVDPISGATELLSTNFLGSVEGIAVSLGGNLLVTRRTQPQAVLRFESDRSISVVSQSAANGADPNDFVNPWGIAVEETGDILVGDISRHTLFRVDPVTGERSIVSGCVLFGTCEELVGDGPLIGIRGVAVVGPEVISKVEVDIKPGSDRNSINPLSPGFIPVAVIGSDTFDVTNIDVTTLAFGRDGAPPAHKKGGHFKDTNHDGIEDLLVHFRTVESGIAPGDEEACVMGETLDETPFEGCDSVSTVPPLM
jgi:hypothetical protein